MTGRYYAAQARVQQFVKAWRKDEATVKSIDLLIVDLEELMKPCVVIRTLPQLQALAVGTIIVVQSNRAAQVEAREEWDLDTGAEIEAKRLIYVGTEFDDQLLPEPLDRETRDTLRRMLPAIVIYPLD